MRSFDAKLERRIAKKLRKSSSYYREEVRQASRYINKVLGIPTNTTFSFETVEENLPLICDKLRVGNNTIKALDEDDPEYNYKHHNGYEKRVEALRILYDIADRAVPKELSDVHREITGYGYFRRF